MTHDLQPVPEDGGDLVAAAFTDAHELGLLGVSKKTDFLPWHLPRKQLCRVDQWLKSVNGLKRELYGHRDPGQTFRYLSLPGDDLLDVRVLTRAFDADADPRLSFMGFNAMGGGARRSESNLSLSEVRAHPAVYPAGTTVLDRKIEEVGQVNSVGFRAFKERAPFDAINLDLTASVIDQGPLTSSSVVQAIHNIIHEQVNGRREPWLLFLTTPIGRPPRINEGALRQLYAPLLQNSQDTRFRDEMIDVLGIPPDLLGPDYEAFTSLSQEPFSRLVGLALGKWLVGLGLNRPDRWELLLLSLYVYRVFESTPDMYSFVFRFNPTVSRSRDITGLTVPMGEQVQQSEVEIALALLAAMRDVRDIDNDLKADPKLLEEVVSLTEKLLDTARYEVSSYREWVEKSMREKGLS